MRKILFLIAIISIILLISCGNTNDDSTTLEPVHNTIATEADVIEVTTPTVLTTSTTETTTIPISTDLGIVEKAIFETNWYARSNLYGMFYDLDFDGRPELLFDAPSVDGITGIAVYKYINDEWQYCRDIYASNYSGDDSQWIDLYYDKNKDEYFYNSNYTYALKNMDDEGSRRIFWGIIIKYSFVDDKLQDEVLDSFGCDDEDEQAKKSFLLLCSEALSSYEKIDTIPIVPMWTEEDIESGAYEQIIRDYFKDNGIAE